MRTCGVYAIVNLHNGKRYIGQSTDIERRFVRHKSSLKTNRHRNLALQADHNAGHTLDYVILVACDKRDLSSHERRLIAEFGTTKPSCGYNTSPGGGSTNFGIKFSEEHNRRISEAISGSKHWNWGRHPSDETLKKMSESNKGDKSAWHGRHHTDETKAKISRAMSGRKHPFPKEVREKLSRAASGLSNHFYGKSHSDETRKKMSDGQKRAWELRRQRRAAA